MNDVVLVVALGALVAVIWVIIPMYLRLRYQRPGLQMELLIVAYLLARLLRIPVD